MIEIFYTLGLFYVVFLMNFFVILMAAGGRGRG